MRIVGGSHLLNALGINAGNMLGRLHALEQQVQNLHTLAHDFGAAAGFMGPSALAQMLQTGGIPAAAHMPSPPWGASSAAAPFYAMPRTFDFGAAPERAPFSMEGLFARNQGVRLERMLERNPFARAQAEMMLGGRILPDGFADGRMTVQPFAPGFFPAGGAGNLAAMHGMNSLNQVQQAAQAGGAGSMAPAGSANDFQKMILNALQNLIQNLQKSAQAGGGANGAGGANEAEQGEGAGGTGEAKQPGQSKWADPVGTDGDNIAQILADPSLTVEDQIVMMLMLIMKNMDKDIKKQAEKVNKLQQKANKAAAEGKKLPDDGENAPSIDIETMKLKRLTDKRNQMFDMLRQVVDKYNQTAKNMIDSIGR